MKADHPGSSKTKPIKRGGKLSLYPLTLEAAIRAATKTGRPPSDEPKRPRQETKAQKISF
jgi:hypothetical protein